MLHKSHAGVTGPALLVVVPHYVFIVGVRMLRQISLNQVSGFISREPEGRKKKAEF